MLSINCKGRLLGLEQPVVMGIINVTPDSFFSGSTISSLDALVITAQKMLDEGAQILDIGGQSTRPGSIRVEAEEEMKRVLPAIEAIYKNFPDAILSIDTFYASVVKSAIDAGASIVNDVSAGSLDKNMISTVAALKVPYVLMHMKGDPQTMQKAPEYQDVLLEVYDFLNFKIAELHAAGIDDIIVDPGFGFGKTADHNLKLLSSLHFFKNLGKPILAGLSRKATIYKTLNIQPEEALNGTTVLNTISLLNGASILRVHDVKQAVETVKLINAYLKTKEQEKPALHL